MLGARATTKQASQRAGKDPGKMTISISAFVSRGPLPVHSRPLCRTSGPTSSRHRTNAAQPVSHRTIKRQAAHTSPPPPLQHAHRQCTLQDHCKQRTAAEADGRQQPDQLLTRLHCEAACSQRSRFRARCLAARPTRAPRRLRSTRRATCSGYEREEDLWHHSSP